MRFALWLSALIIASFSGALAHAGQHEIEGFRYHDCNTDFCIEVSAERAWLSQMDFGFTTEDKTTVVIHVKKSSISTAYNGTVATLHPRIKLLTLDFADGKSMSVSTSDGSVSMLGVEP